MLGCGAIENARLLLASRDRRPTGLGNSHDAVGRYFQDHPKGFTGLLAVDPAAPRLPASGYWPSRATAHGRTRWGIGLTDAAQRREQVLNSYVRLEPTVLDHVPDGIAALKRAVRGRVRGLDPHDLTDLAADAPALARLARFRLRNEGPIDVVRVRSFLEQEPRRASRVRLSDRRDPLGRPLAAVDWNLSDLDRRSVRVLHEALVRAFRRQGLGELQADLDDGSPTWDDLSDASHHAGTTRMGTDPRTSVTDPSGEVHDVPGLFVVGASLFPTSGYANPVFTIAATALHVADAVAARAAAPLSVRPAVADRDAAASTSDEVPATRPEPTPAGTAEAKRWLAARRRARRPRPAASTGTAIVWTGRGRAEVVPVEVPAPGQGQVSVLVDVSAVSLGTERARWMSLPGAAVRYPHQPGYSLSGTVHAVGPGVYDIEPGTPVAVWGAPHQSLVTVDRSQVHVLAERADLASAALVTLGAIAELGVARAGDVTGRSLAVVGAGAIGLLAQRIGAAEGAKPCTVVAASTAKDGVVAGDPGAVSAPPAAVDRLAADAVVEATGAAAGLDLAVRAAARGGTVVVLGTTRAEAVAVPLDLVASRALRVVGAHAGLLDAPGGTAGLDRRSAAQRFLDRVATGAVRVDDLVTFHADPAGAADLLDRVGSDRSQVVPVIEWWRLAPDLRARAGGLDLPNPFRRGLDPPLPPGERTGPGDRATTHHPTAPARRGADEPVVGGWSADAAAIARAARAAAVSQTGGSPGAGRVRVQGDGALAEAVQALLTDVVGDAERDGGEAAVVVDVDPTSSTVTAALSTLGPDGVVLVAGRVGRVEIDVQTDVHRRGATVAGVPAPQDGAGQDG